MRRFYSQKKIVARAIYNCDIPVISAVGHEIDFTIADFVADLRAPTPTAAAELAVPNMSDLKSHISQLGIRLNEAIYKKINYQKLYLDSIKNSYVIKSPMIMFENKKQSLDLLKEKINELVLRNIQNKKDKLDSLRNSYILTNPQNIYKDKKVELKNIIDKLNLLNPLNVLGRGYSISYVGGKVLKSISLVKENSEVDVKLSDGTLKTVIQKIEKEK